MVMKLHSIKGFRLWETMLLFLSQTRSKFIDAHWFLHELFKRSEISWVSAREETVADFRVSFFYSRYVSPFLEDELSFIWIIAHVNLLVQTEG